MDGGIDGHMDACMGAGVYEWRDARVDTMGRTTLEYIRCCVVAEALGTQCHHCGHDE